MNQFDEKANTSIGAGSIGYYLLCCFFVPVFLQYPVQRYFVEKDINHIQQIESELHINPASLKDLEKLLDYVGHSPGPTKSSAIRSLGRIDADNFDEVRILADLLSHQDHGTRRSVILALKDQGDKAITAMPQIIQSLNDPVAVDVPVFAAQILGELGADAEPALNTLRKIRDDPNFLAFTNEFNKAIEMIESELVSEQIE